MESSLNSLVCAEKEVPTRSQSVFLSGIAGITGIRGISGCVSVAGAILGGWWYPVVEVKMEMSLLEVGNGWMQAAVD